MLNLPTEIIHFICDQLYSPAEFISLGQTCSRFHQILKKLKDETLCKIECILLGRQISVNQLSLSLADAESLQWATSLICRSVADTLSKRPNQTWNILAGCRKWSSKGNMLRYYLQEAKGYQVDQRLRWLNSKIQQNLFELHRPWFECLVNIGRNALLTLAEEGHGRAACKVLGMFQEELALHREEFDLSHTRVAVAISLAQNGDRSAYKALKNLKHEAPHNLSSLTAREVAACFAQQGEGGLAYETLCWLHRRNGFTTPTQRFIFCLCSLSPRIRKGSLSNVSGLRIFRTGRIQYVYFRPQRSIGDAVNIAGDKQYLSFDDGGSSCFSCNYFKRVLAPFQSENDFFFSGERAILTDAKPFTKKQARRWSPFITSWKR